VRRKKRRGGQAGDDSEIAEIAEKVGDRLHTKLRQRNSPTSLVDLVGGQQRGSSELSVVDETSDLKNALSIFNHIYYSMHRHSISI
jgi:hypothetical protein